MDATDRQIINALQHGFPVSERPFLEAATGLGIGEDDLIGRLQALLDDGILSRFGPLYHAERLGGALTLAAMAVPKARFEAVADLVNAHAEVAHNYARDHVLNMWFVLATERALDISRVITEIETETALPVYEMPKLDEFFIGLRFDA